MISVVIAYPKTPGLPTGGMLGILITLLLSVTMKTDSGDTGEDDDHDDNDDLCCSSRHLQQEGSFLISWSI